MAIRRHRKLAILHKIESGYGVDAAPAAADAIIATNVTITPIEADEVSRDLMLPYMGQQGITLEGQHAKIEFDVEIAGAGAAGTVPRYGSLLRVSGMAQIIDPGVKVTYQIVEDDTESGSLYFVSDKVQHVMLGCRATWTMSFAPKAIPRFRFSMIGMLGTITDLAAMPAVTMAGWTTPATVSKANTTMTLHGWSSVAESLSLDLGNTLVPRFLIGDEEMMIGDRSSSGSAVVVAQPLSVVNWFERAQARTRDALSLVHGKTAGNIVEAASPAVEIGKPTQGERDGIVNYSLPLSLCPLTGMDEIALIVR
ncbi:MULTISPECIES: phage tail tube protein [Rhodovulum]|uniref:Uncharacterized protein n=2 Tax=Rhodovulum TaxID=34008 RepID=A0A844BNZ2_9RHOB|nr:MULTISPECIES: phage tail tube protein [Rhodovulum]MRH22653.1 hypothetical protein [Rhodovulum strictum]TCM84781.1 hypothetical protein EV216_11099 [Rhodovulum steppense]